MVLNKKGFFYVNIFLIGHTLSFRKVSLFELKLNPKCQAILLMQKP